MDPKHLSSFLGKYEKLPLPKRHLKSFLQEFLGIESGIHDISLRNGELHVKASSIVKQEIFLKKKKIIAFLKNKELGISITDIR